MLASGLQAQDRINTFLSLEGGMNTLSAKMNNTDYIRADIPNYYSYDGSGTTTSLMTESYAGIKGVRYFWNDDIGFTAGIRYTKSMSTAGKNSYWGSNSEYFYFLFQENGLQTAYLKVSEIRQQSDYIGIPLEFRYLPRHSERVRFYMVYGMLANFRLSSKTNIVFVNEAMEKYENQAVKLIDEPASFQAWCFAGFGINFHNEHKLVWGLEANLPVLALTRSTTGLNKPTAGTGFQINFQLPLQFFNHEN
jgi:hypothetical protein